MVDTGRPASHARVHQEMRPRADAQHWSGRSLVRLYVEAEHFLVEGLRAFGILAIDGEVAQVT